MPKCAFFGLSILALLLFAAADQARSDEIPAYEEQADEIQPAEVPPAEEPVEEEPVEEEPPVPAKTSEPTAYGAQRGGYVALSGFFGYDLSDDWEETLLDENDEIIGFDTRDETSNGGGVTARVGFRVWHPLAIELQGDYFSGYSEFGGWLVTANVRFYPMEIWRETPGRFQVYFVGGAGVIGGDPNVPKNYQLEGAFRFGTGINYYFTDQLALDVGMDWTVGRSAFKDTRYIKFAAGLQYNF